MNTFAFGSKMSPVTGMLVAVFMSSLGFTLLHPAQTQALNGADFRSGNIVADNIFFSDNALSQSQIKAFLEAKVPVCDTYGTQRYSSSMTRAQYAATKGYQPPFTCLKDYAQNTPTMTAESDLCNGMTTGYRTSSEIIYDVSRSCGVSSKVLLVLLQKEQSLITDDWPLPNQYQKATGFGCPDTAPCDPSYAGFFYQVYNAARQFKKYARDASNYNYRSGRNNLIQYHPNTACGNTSVYIQNQATAGLYAYTPYQPNPAALNNLYGSGDSCSAYGNRNFWRMFNDWFGSTQFWSLMRTQSSPALFKISSSSKISIPSQELQEEYGYGSQPVSYVDQATLDAYSSGSPYSTLLKGNLVKTADDGDRDGATVYLITRGKKYIIPSIETFNQYGFGSWDITYTPIQLIDEIPGTSSISLFVQAPDNSVYKIEDGKRRVIFDLATLQNVNPSGIVTPASNYFLGQLQPGKPIISSPSLVVFPDASVDLLLPTGEGYKITSSDTLLCWGMTSGSYRLSQFRVPSWSNMKRSNDGTLSCRIEEGGAKYIMNGANKIALPSGSNIPAASNLPSTVYGRLPTQPDTLRAAVKTLGSNRVWFIDNTKGTKRPVQSIDTYLALGITDATTTTLTESAVNAIPTGGYKLSDGQLVQTPNSPAVYVINGDERLNIPSAELMDAYGFDWNRISRVTEDNLRDYPVSGKSLQYIYYDETDIFMAGISKAYRIPTTLYEDYAIDSPLIRSSSTQLSPRAYSQLAIHQSDATTFAKSQSKDTIYYVQDGLRHPLGSWSKYMQLSGNDPYAIITLPDALINRLTLSSTLY